MINKLLFCILKNVHNHEDSDDDIIWYRRMLWGTCPSFLSVVPSANQHSHAPRSQSHRHSVNKQIKKWFFIEGSGYFLSDTKHNVHRFSLNLHDLQIMKVASFPWNIHCLGAAVFEKWVKQFRENNFCLSETIFF